MSQNIDALTIPPQYTSLDSLTPKQHTTRFVQLLQALVVRDIRARYRRSLLGPFWAIIQPLVMMVVFSFLRGIANIPTDGIPPIIFSFSALVPWTFFSNAVSGIGQSITVNSPIIKKIAVSREVFVVSALASAGFDMLMSGLIMAGMMVYYRVPVNLTLLWLPLLTLLTALLAAGVGMFLAALGTFKRDFLYAGTFLLQFWLYATPIIYPLSSIDEKWRWLYILDPMVGILEGFRSVLALGQPPDLGLLAAGLPVTALILAITWPFFRSMSQYFADVL